MVVPVVADLAGGSLIICLLAAFVVVGGAAVAEPVDGLSGELGNFRVEIVVDNTVHIITSNYYNIENFLQFPTYKVIIGRLRVS